MRTHHQHNQFHFGDCALHLNFLRRLALAHSDHRFEFSGHLCHLPQLNEIVEDVPNISLLDIEKVGPMGIGVWKNEGGYWERSPHRWDFVAFHLDWFQHLSRRMGLPSPIRTRDDLLFDYPALQREVLPGMEFDVLVVNSNPQSAQFLDYQREDSMDEMIWALISQGLRVITTKPVQVWPSTCVGLVPPCTLNYGLTCSQIGALSNRVPHHVMVSTGPSWGTFNVFNRDTTKTRLLFIGNGETVKPTADTINCATFTEGMRLLREKGLIE